MNDATTKPPPLHERSDALNAIASQYDPDRNHNMLGEFRAEFRGALKLLIGTAIPKEHAGLIGATASGATLLGMPEDETVLAALEWVRSEKERHAPKVAAPAQESQSETREGDAQVEPPCDV